MKRCYNNHLNESFSSKKLSSLFKNKEALNVFKKNVFDRFNVAWSDIQDKDVDIYNLSTEIKKYMSGKYIYDQLCENIYYGHPDFKKAILVFVCDGDIIRISRSLGNTSRISVYYDAPNNMCINKFSLRKLNRIYTNYIEPLTHYGAFYEDLLPSILYVRNGKVDLLKTLYKAFILCCYDFMSDVYDRRMVGMLCDDYQYGPDNKRDVLSLFKWISPDNCSVYMTTKTMVRVKCEDDGFDHEFDFESRYLHKDHIPSKAEKYANILYDIDSERKIMRGFFIESLLYFLSLSRAMCDDVSSNEIDIKCFSLPFLVGCSLEDGYHDFTRFISKIVYLEQVLGKRVDIYHITLDNENAYCNKVRQRKINKITDIDFSARKLCADYMESDYEEYEYYKYALKVLHDHDYEIRQVAKKLGGDDERMLIGSYEMLLLMDKCFDNTDMSSAAYDPTRTLVDFIDQFTDIVTNVSTKRSMIHRMYFNIRNFYESVVDRNEKKCSLHLD